MKKRRKKLKIVSFLLSISLLVTAFTPFTVFAEEPSHEQLTDSSQLWTPEQEEPLPNTEGDLPLEELETAELASEDIPEMVSQVAIEQKVHVNRLWSQEEDLNTVIFQNRDGKKTMYYFTEPVKYKDKDGNIKDKKNKLTEQENTYTNAENDINSYFPKKIHKNKGVVLRHKYIVGDSYRCVWVMREYPPSTDEQAILFRLADRNDVTLRIYNRLVEGMEQKQIVQNATRKNKLKSGGSY